MKRRRSIFVKATALAITLMMVTATGCASQTPSSSSNSGTTTQSTQTTQTEEKTPEAPAANDPAPVVDAANAPTLIWIMGDPGTVPPDQTRVEEKMNEWTLEKLGVKVKTLYYDGDKVKLAMSSGEDWDMVFTCEWYNNYADQAISGYFADLTDKLPTVAPTLYDTMPEIVWTGAKIDGRIYAIPVKKDYAAEQFYILDKALFVDELGMDVPESMKFEDIEPYLKAAKEAYEAGSEAAKQAEYPLKYNKDGFSGIDSNFDMINRDVLLGIPYSAVGTADATTVRLTLETPDLVERFQYLHKWFTAGYINKDAPTVDDVGKYKAVSTGQGFYGADAIWSGSNGYTVVISKRDGPFLSAASVRGSMNAINVRSKYIDESLKYQEMVNTDLQLRDTLRYGLEGEHWNKTPEGLAQRTQAGRDGYSPWAFSQGSYSLSTVEAADGVSVDPKMWDVVFKGYEELVATDTMGFTFDSSNVQAQIAACVAIKEKYWRGLNTGSSNPDETLPKFISELESAGIREIMEECQSQLDAFMANK